MLAAYPTSFNSFISRNASQASQPDVNPNLSPYGYTPTFDICILFLTLFGLSTFIHFCQAIVYRKWFFLYTAVFAGLIEAAGWSGRLWSSENVSNPNAFLIQIVCTIIAPTPLLAANFIILARIIKKLGDCYSRLGPRLYSKIFLSCDIIALVVQGAGGGIASNTVAKSVLNAGSHIMLAGIIFQLTVMICYMILAAEFFWRYSRVVPFPGCKFKVYRLTRKNKLLIYALSFNTVCLFIRAIYRTVELADGFDGKVIQTQWLFNIFDATMVVLAMYTHNIAHFGLLLDESETMNTDNSSAHAFLEKLQLDSTLDLHARV